MATSRRSFLRWGAGSFALSHVPWFAACSEQGLAVPAMDAGVAPPLDAGSAPDSATDAADAPVNEGPWWMAGAFAPTVESEHTALQVTGSLPPQLEGLYVRNGPNPRDAASDHWFTGDGMLHGVRLSAGQAEWYRARYVQTERTSNSLGPPGGANNDSNVSMLWHADRLMSLGEVGHPFEINPADLSTVGSFDYGDMLGPTMTAHPKVDLATGELFAFGYYFTPPFLRYYRMDAAGQLQVNLPIELPESSMHHDFQVTTNYVVFMDMPVLFGAGEGTTFPYAWRPGREAGTRIGVLRRDATEADVTWLAIDTCYCFHTLNAYEDEQGRIVLDAQRYAELWVDDNADFSLPGSLWRFTLDVDAQTVSEGTLLDVSMEFPQVDPRLRSRRHRYAYGVQLGEQRRGSGEPDLSTTTVKVDVDSLEARRLDHGTGRFPGEMVFVPDDAGEDEGWLLGYVHDATTQRSELVVVDAQTMQLEATVEIPTRVPRGFHGVWVPDP